MSLDMIGEWIPILLNRNQVILDGYYYDFVMRIKAKILCRCVATGTEKENECLLVVVSKRCFVDRGRLDRTRGQSVAR